MSGVWSGYTFTPRYHEIDGQGVMFYMWYLGHVAEAVDGFFVHCGLPRADWPDIGFDVHAVHVDLDFRAGVRARDVAEVLISPFRIGRKSFTLDFAFRRNGEIVCNGGVVYATVSAEGTIELPGRLVAALGEVRSLRD